MFRIWEIYNYKNKKLGGYPISTVLDGENHNSVSRVINRSVEAGLLFIIKDYYHGKNRTESRPGVYDKNDDLFKEIFGEKFIKWLKETKDEKINTPKKNSKSVDEKINEIDIDGLCNKDINDAIKITKLELEEIKLKVKTNYYKKAKSLEELIKAKEDRKLNKLLNFNYDIFKLYELKKELLPHYFDLMKKLNAATRDNGLKFVNFLKFDDEGLPLGRPWCQFCATLNDKKEHEGIDLRKSRKDYLSKIGLGDYTEVFDIKSQVPRINYLFHTGEWKPNGYDFYAEIIETVRRSYFSQANKEIEKSVPSRGSTVLTHKKDTMKEIFMRIFFKTGSAKKKFDNYDYELHCGESRLETKKRARTNFYDKKPVSRQDEAVKLKPQKIIYDEDFNAVDYFEETIEISREEIYNFYNIAVTKDEWLDLYFAAEKIVKPSIDNLIWWFCFIMETEVRIELLKRGKEVYNVYDGFYYDKKFKKEMEMEIQEILAEKSRMVYEKWMEPLHLSDDELKKRINKKIELATRPDKKPKKKQKRV